MENQRARPRVIGRAVALALLLGTAPLAGCASVVAGADVPTVIYDLDIPDPGATRLGSVVAIPSATAIGALANERVAVRPTPLTYAYYPAVTWSDALPALVQTRLVQAFENARSASEIGRSSDGIAARFQLLVDVRAFELVAGTPAQARVSLSAKLLSLSSGRIAATTVIDTTAAAVSDEAPDAAAALNEAFALAARDLVAWTGARL